MPLLIAAVLALLALAAPASAATVTVSRAVDRDCLSPRAGTAPLRHVARTGGLVVARLDGRRGDWDLALLDARGRRVGAGASAGAREQAIAGARRGEVLTVLACRRRGSSRTARLTVREHALRAPGTTASILRVRGDADRLERLGFDVTHNHDAGHADVVVRSAAERLRLTAAGFTYTTEVADLAAQTRAALRDRATARQARALPSGRTSYRTLADYGEDLKALAAAHPGLVKRIEVGRSLEDRPIEGVEIASNVEAADDGRPVFLVLGLHHAREWPSGEMPMELAIDLARGYGKNARITALLDRVRVIALPVVNPDGFEVSRSSPDIQTLEQGAYKRKNCRPTTEAAAAIPCALRFSQGVDLNRNYGAYWGGVGSSTDPTSQAYRGPAPFSEPESEAIHRLSSTRNIVTVISHHTYTSQGTWLRQPGFCPNAPSGCGPEDVVPDEAGMKALGDAMGEATGWLSQLGWAIGQITGATEDWNYFATGAYGYTPEQRGSNFHPAYATAVISEYDGTGPGAAGGVREALLRAAENTADPANHAVLLGTATPGATLRLRKAFTTPTSQAAVAVADQLDLTMRVRADGTYAWHVNQSTRPLSPAPESYELRCEAADGTLLERRDVTVARGQALTVNLCPPQPQPPATRTPAPGPAAEPGTAAAPRPAAPAPARSTPRLRISRRRASARFLNHRRGMGIALRLDGGTITRVHARLTRGGRTYARARIARLRGDARIRLRRERRIVPGRYVIRVSARDAAGRAVRASRAVRVRR